MHLCQVKGEKMFTRRRRATMEKLGVVKSGFLESDAHDQAKREIRSYECLTFLLHYPIISMWNRCFLYYFYSWDFFGLLQTP